MRSRYHGNFWITTIGSLSNDNGDGDGDGNENGKKSKCVNNNKQNNNFARSSHFFCTFLSRRSTTAT